MSVATDLAIPVAILAVMQHNSPQGAYAALSGPSLLGLPLVTMLSTLRLRPGMAFLTGLFGAIAHWALVISAIRIESIDEDQWPALFTYGVFLAITGAAAAVVAAQARANVAEAVADAIAKEASERERAAIERDLNVARDIQKSLMPATPPDMPGFDIAGMARPAQQTGGDYYDWQPLRDGRLVVVLADVTGHGIGPALVMAVCRAYARASLQIAPDAAALLSQVNQLVYEDLSQTGRFITMVIAILSPDGAVELVSAGHGPTLLLRATTGNIETFGGDGPPLGIMPDVPYGPPRRMTMHPGDSLLLVTDGYVEWARADDRKQFGAERLKESLRAAAAATAHATLDSLDAAVRAFTNGAPQLDDTTAVAIKRT